MHVLAASLPVRDCSRRLLTLLAALLMLLALLAGRAQAAEPSGGLTLPDGFVADVIADDLGPARHIAVRENGDLYISLRRKQPQGGVVALRDADGDGTYETKRQFGDVAGTGIAIHDGHLYFGTRTSVVRWALADGELVPTGEMQTVVRGMPNQGGHAAKPITFDGKGHLFLNVGAPSNACQAQQRTPGNPGQQPCPQLEQAGVWRFDASKLNQRYPDDALHFATGLRQCVALEYNTLADGLFVVMHGRDQLHQLWPDLYTAEQSAELPAEEFHLLKEGANCGWPYTYWDQRQGKRIVAPEYGGGPDVADESGKYQQPLVGFPGHWAPNDLIFLRGENLPSKYRGAALIAFHGSWNRSPLPQQGYKVGLVRMDGLKADPRWEVFADGFAGQERIRSPRQAEHRPMGLAEGPDGAIFITDSQRGRVWRVRYVGE